MKRRQTTGRKEENELTGAEKIAKERERQISEEGYDSQHDDEHDTGALAMAAACYASGEKIYVREDFAAGLTFKDPWPWQSHFDKRPYVGNVPTPRAARRSERIDLLTKAGALIAAEIDRLLRLERKFGKS